MALVPVPGGVVANRDSDSVSVIDTRSYRILAEVKVGDAPFGLALDPVSRRIYAVNVRGNSVSVIDPDKLEVVATLEGRKKPYA
ncbi:MAG: hypothetical protein ABF290_03075 [Thiogranum sp.]